jgi:integrase
MTAENMMKRLESEAAETVLDENRRAQHQHAIAEWTAAAEGAYAKNTQRAWRADWTFFYRYCEETKQIALPASPATVSTFIHHCVAQQKKAATIRRYLATITRAHKAARCVNPCDDEIVKLALRAAQRSITTRQKQAKGLSWDAIQFYLTIEPTELRDYRDRALVMVAYDALLRREEVVAAKVEDLELNTDGSATLLIRKSKTDQEGEGALQYLAPDTVRLLRHWIGLAGITDGEVFRRVIGKKRVAEPLTPASVVDVFQRVGKWLGLPKETWKGSTGHSARVGVTQDLVAQGMGDLQIAQAGQWKDSRMPQRYGERLRTTQGAVANLVAMQKRI